MSTAVSAAQQLTCAIPLLVVLSAIRLIAGGGNFGVQLSRFLGLSAKATDQLASVFAASVQVRDGTTLLGLMLLVIFALGLAQAHQRFYELTWCVDAPNRRLWHRHARWVGGVLAYAFALGAVARMLGGAAAARPVFIAICAPITAAFYWWSQLTLLAGRVPARSLIPGAVITSLGVSGLLVISPWWVSNQITSSVREFGAIGVTFVLAAWQLVLSTLVLAGTLAGAVIVNHRHGVPAGM